MVGPRRAQSQPKGTGRNLSTICLRIWEQPYHEKEGYILNYFSRQHPDRAGSQTSKRLACLVTLALLSHTSPTHRTVTNLVICYPLKKVPNHKANSLLADLEKARPSSSSSSFTRVPPPSPHIYFTSTQKFLNFSILKRITSVQHIS